jgi:uncharacterized protein with PQ loop repeat
VGTVHDSPTILGVFALAYGILAAAAPLLQARRVIVRRSAGDLSITWMALYAGGCVVWLLYGISISSTPLIVSQGLALMAIGIALAVSARFRDGPQPATRARVVSAAGRGPTLGSPHDARQHRALDATRVEQLMSEAVISVSSQITVEEATRRLSRAREHDGPFAVVDSAGHAVNALDWADMLRVPRTERPARLVADVRGRAVLVEGSAEVDEVLGRPGLARVDAAIVVDARRDPIGLVDLAHVRHASAAHRRYRRASRARFRVRTRT